MAELALVCASAACTVPGDQPWANAHLVSKVREHSDLWTSVDATLPSPLSCYGPLTGPTRTSSLRYDRVITLPPCAPVPACLWCPAAVPVPAPLPAVLTCCYCLCPVPCHTLPRDATCHARSRSPSLLPLSPQVETSLEMSAPELEVKITLRIT